MLTWDWVAAEASFAQALAFNPSYEAGHRAYGVMLAMLGRYGEAVREADRASELDPLCLVVNTSAAWVRYAAGDYDWVINQCRLTIDMDVECRAAWGLLGAAYLQAGQHAEALQAFASALEHSPHDPVLIASYAHATGVAGKRGEAVSLIARLRELEAGRYVPAFHVALAYVGVDQAEAAFDALDGAFIDRDPLLASLAVEPRFEPLRSDARFSMLLDRLNLASLNHSQAGSSIRLTIP